jgi:hypothetical protein
MYICTHVHMYISIWWEFFYMQHNNKTTCLVVKHLARSLCAITTLWLMYRVCTCMYYTCIGMFKSVYDFYPFMYKMFFLKVARAGERTRDLLISSCTKCSQSPLYIHKCWSIDSEHLTLASNAQHLQMLFISPREQRKFHQLWHLRSGQSSIIHCISIDWQNLFQ